MNIDFVACCLHPSAAQLSALAHSPLVVALGCWVPSCFSLPIGLWEEVQGLRPLPDMTWCNPKNRAGPLSYHVFRRHGSLKGQSLSYLGLTLELSYSHRHYFIWKHDPPRLER